MLELEVKRGDSMIPKPPLNVSMTISAISRRAPTVCFTTLLISRDKETLIICGEKFR